MRRRFDLLLTFLPSFPALLVGAAFTQQSLLPVNAAFTQQVKQLSENHNSERNKCPTSDYHRPRYHRTTRMTVKMTSAATR